jgi:hypothetical protein
MIFIWEYFLLPFILIPIFETVISSLKNMRLQLGFFLLSAAFLLVISGCCYSFTGGATVSGTYSVSFFENKASIVNPSLSQTFTEKLKDKIRRESKLTMVPEGGDFSFSGYISNYSVAPVGIQNGDQASLNRLTITVNLKFENRKDSKQNFEQQVSQYSDFPGSTSLAQVESALVDEITDKLVQEIMNRTVNNW